KFISDFGVYGGRADANAYSYNGTRIAAAIHAGQWSHLPMTPGSFGTHVIDITTGVIYSVTGTTVMGAGLVYSWLGFWGLYFFYRAFRIGFPEGEARRYGYLIFFLPSLLFWTSSIGKDAWIMFSLGLATYGGAKLMARHRGAYAIVLIGLGLTSLVRIHIAAALFIGLFAAFIARRSSGDRVWAAFGKGVGIVVLTLVGVVIGSQFRAFFGVNKDLQSGGISQVFEKAQHGSEGGSSDFNAKQIQSPADVPMAVVSVIFRPLPFDANNTTALLASIEGTVLLGLFVVSWPRI